MRTGVAPLTAMALDAEVAESSPVADVTAITAETRHVMEMHNTMRETRRTVLGDVNLPLIIQAPYFPGNEAAREESQRGVGTSKSVRPGRRWINGAQLRISSGPNRHSSFRERTSVGRPSSVLGHSQG